MPTPQTLFNFQDRQDRTPFRLLDGSVKLLQNNVYQVLTAHGAGFSWTYPDDQLKIWSDRANIKLRQPFTGRNPVNALVTGRAQIVYCPGMYEAIVAVASGAPGKNATRGPAGVELYGRAAFVFNGPEGPYVGEPQWLNAEQSHLTVGKKFADGIWIEPRNFARFNVRCYEFPACPRSYTRTVPGDWNPRFYPDWYQTIDVPLYG